VKPETIQKKEIAKEVKYIAILDAAEKVIKKDGLSGMSISKVARAAKIAKGTVYIYFDSKEEIIGGLTIRARSSLLEYFKKYCGMEKDPIERIKNIFWADYHFYKEQKTYHELVAFYEQNTGLKETKDLARSSFEISNYVKEIIEDAKSKKLIRKDIDSGLQGFIFWGMTVGILQIIDTKNKQLKKYFGKTPKEFFAHFVDNTVASITT